MGNAHAATLAVQDTRDDKLITEFKTQYEDLSMFMRYNTATSGLQSTVTRYYDLPDQSMVPLVYHLQAKPGLNGLEIAATLCKQDGVEVGCAGRVVDNVLVDVAIIGAELCTQLFATHVCPK